jgi:hypothetical protein
MDDITTRAFSPRPEYKTFDCCCTSDIDSACEIEEADCYKCCNTWKNPATPNFDIYDDHPFVEAKTWQEQKRIHTEQQYGPERKREKRKKKKK